MIQLVKALHLWGTPDFEPCLKAEVEKLGVDQLPLQQALSSSNIALDDDMSAVIMRREAQSQTINVRVAIFYTGMISGCSCADDPTPVPRENEYCEVLLEIDRNTGETAVSLVSE